MCERMRGMTAAAKEILREESLPLTDSDLTFLKAVGIEEPKQPVQLDLFQGDFQGEGDDQRR